MNTMATKAALCLCATGMLTGCSLWSVSDPGFGPGPGLSKLQPTPAIASEVEVGGGSRSARRSAAALGFGAIPLERIGDAMPGDARINAVSTENPTLVLGRSASNSHQPHNNAGARLLQEFKGWPVPTGKWSKGFFYQSPTNLEAWFQGKPGQPGQPPDLNNIIDPQNYSVFAFPNKLWLDDRIGMVTVVFPRRRRVALDRASDSAIYDLRNPYKADYVPYNSDPGFGPGLAPGLPGRWHRAPAAPGRPHG